MMLNALSNPKVSIQNCQSWVKNKLIMSDRFLRVRLRHFSSLVFWNTPHFTTFASFCTLSHAFPLASEMTELKFVLMHWKAQAMPVALAGAHSKLCNQ